MQVSKNDTQAPVVVMHKMKDELAAIRGAFSVRKLGSLKAAIGFQSAHMMLRQTYPPDSSFARRNAFLGSALQAVGPLQIRENRPEQILIRVAAGHAEDHAPHAYPHVCPYFQ